MTDTDEKTASLLQEMLLQKSDRERLIMAFSMLDSARRIVLSTFDDKDKWRQEMFLRFYGSDFTTEQKMRILTALQTYEDGLGHLPIH